MIRKKKTKQSLPYILAAILMMMLVSPSLLAQNTEITGKIIDNNREPLAGATVVVKGTTVVATAGADGEYKILAPQGSVLVFSFVGYVSREESLNGRTRIEVSMTPDATILDDVVVVAYGSQRKVTLTGAVSGVKGTEMRQTKNENPQNMLTGRIAGVRVWQKSAEPGTFNNNFDIRGLGAPLVIIDGIPRSTAEFQRLSPNDIEDISVLKDASAAIYGVRAANGVLLVSTKKGVKNEKTKVTYNGSYTMQQPSGMPVLADPFETMTIYNEKAKNIGNDGTTVSPIYGPDKFEEYRNGTRRSADWTSLLFHDIAPQTQHELSISGGGEKVRFYVGMGYMYQMGIFKSGDLNYSKYNLRSNISAEILKGLTFDLNLSGIADNRNNPYSSAHDIIRNYWRQGVLFPAYADNEETMLSYEGLDLMENTVAKMTADVSGYRKYRQKYFQSSAELKYDLGTILPALKGLTVKAMIGYDYRMDNNTTFRKEYSLYAYNANTGAYEQRLYNTSSPNQLRRDFYDKYQVLSQYTLNYDRSFGSHKVTGVLGWETQKNSSDNYYSQGNLAFASPYLFNNMDEGQVSFSDKANIIDRAYAAMIGRANYTFADRYMAEVQFRYDGSSLFAPGHRWGFFPSASAGWIISEEPFFKNIAALSFVKHLKVRASYGVLGDDSGAEYQWTVGYTYPSTNSNKGSGYYNQYAPGYIFGGQFISAMSPLAIPNLDITWFTSHMFNLGVNFEGWNGLFGLTFDYFDRRRDGRFARRTGDMPTVVGATAPQENLNSDRHFGIDLELTHRNRIGDFSYKIKTITTITRQQYKVATEKGPYGNSYDQWKNDNLNNRFQGVRFGYEAAGRYENWNDIWYYPIYKDRDVLPGDYKYVDWNGDGEINGQDEHPFAYDQTPWLNYSVNFDFAYRNFDLSLLFQGSALGSMQYQEPLYSIWGSNGGGTLEQYLDRWHPVDPNADLYDPATEWISGHYGYTGRYPLGNSEFNRVSTAYLRLKSIELGYTLPKIKALPALNMRVFANAYNLFTITKVKFVDPEHPEDELGRLYPLNKTYTLGLSITF